MGDRTRQIAREWLAKCADVVLDARELAATPRDARDGGMKANRWFNCACARRRETTRAMERDEAAREGGTSAARKLEDDSNDSFVEGAVTVDVYFERGGDASTSGERALVERWAFHAGADGGGVGGNNHFNKDLDTAVVYKRAVIMVRTVVAMLRTLPAHGARLRAMRRRGARDGGGGGGFSFEIKNVDDGGTIASAHPGKAEGYRTYAFTDVPTSIGKLSACVYFLDQVAMSALEDECVAGVETAPTPCERLDASVGPDVVALAGGEMSLSPSPTGKSDAPESLQRARREEDSSPMSRGILFDEASPSPSPNAGPPIRGGMTASLSSGSLQQQAKPPVSPSVVPLADYTSPNYQRFDNAPSSAPNNGPAPIYGFNAAPIGAKHALQSAIESPLVEPPRPPPRRSTMASCLKIDVGTSIDKHDFDIGAPNAAIAVAQPPPPPVPASPTTTTGFSPTTAAPIACSPRVRTPKDVRSGPAPHGSPSPWGGFVCPESPIPSPGGAAFAHPRSVPRSSWSPSSSLGTSIRDVVGVYPHSPGGVSNFARRMSGASDDAAPGSPLTPHAADESIDNQDEFPFAIDDADATATATYVEHTPADLLSLLENSCTLRRRSLDGPLPLDAALEDSTDSIVNRSAELDKSVGGDDKSRAASNGMTLGSALRALAELDVAAKTQFTDV